MSVPNRKPIRPSENTAMITAVRIQMDRGRPAIRWPIRAHGPREVGSGEPYRGL